ncbi:MAG: hypothetical protein AAFO88_09940 [Pseudomonadota bacterium]
MRTLKATLLLTVALGCSAMAEARPVSYPGGWTVMQRNTGDFSSLHVHYSPTFQDSVGAYVEHNWEGDYTFAGGQYNRLVKRWNTPKSQANLYLNLGAGYAETFDETDEGLAGFAGVAADWETRRWFTSYQVRAYDLGFDRDVHHNVRVGVAPYIGDFGDLHTWLMLEVQNSPESDTPTTLTPLVRFFYGVQLVEVGYTPETERFMANWIVRF